MRGVCSARFPRIPPEVAARVRWVPTEVVATPRAEQQIAGLDRIHAKAFSDFLDDLAARGCEALGYRLSGPAPVDHMCIKHLRGSFRVVVAFEGRPSGLDTSGRLPRRPGSGPERLRRAVSPARCRAAGRRWAGQAAVLRRGHGPATRYRCRSRRVHRTRGESTQIKAPASLAAGSQAPWWRGARERDRSYSVRRMGMGISAAANKQARIGNAW